MPRLSSQKQDGFILIVVLGAVMVLSTLLFRFSRATQTRLETTYGLYRVEQAWNCARAGLSIAQAGVAETNDVCADRRFAALFEGEDPLPVGEGTCLVRIVEENGLLNVNRLLDKTGQPDRARVDQMLRLIDLLNRNGGGKEHISYGIVPSVIDWVDPDDAVTHLSFVERANRGAEDAYYRGQRPPYRCVNRPVDTLDELLRIRAMTPEAHGRLRPVLTCYGEGQININTAPMPVIMCLSEQMDAAMAQMIVNHRQMRPFESVAELRDVPGMTDKIFQAVRDFITVSPKMRYYRVISEGTSDGRSCTVEAVLFRNRQAQNVDMLYYTEH